jgi:drug/metabolite transporter (DMT)-like permease
MTVLLGPFAWLDWHPVAPRDWLLILAIGGLSQIGLFCFVTAHRLASAAILAPIGYLQLILAPVAAYLVFGEWPTPALLAGGTIIIAAGLWNTLRR